MTYIMGHDLGTSRHKAVLTTDTGTLVACASEPLALISARDDEAEQSPAMWWQAVVQTTRAVLREAGVNPREVAALSFTGQTQATLPVDASGTPLCDALIWLDTRAKAQSRKLLRGWPRYQSYGVRRLFHWLRLTNGAPTLTGRDTLAKCMWLREMRPELWQRVHRVLDAKDWLLFRCTGRYVTSYDCAHLTWLMDARRHVWSPRLLRQADLCETMLPALQPATSSAGPLTYEAAGALRLPAGIPVVVGALDVVSLQVGTGALEPGEAAVGLGTSAWVSAHVRRHRVSVSNYTASITSAFQGRPLAVAHQELGGGCVAWFLRMVRGHLGPAGPSEADYTWLQEAVRQTVPGADGLLFTPWLAGEYAPLQESAARGCFFGLGLQHQAAHLARAVLEGVAYNLRWALQAVQGLTRQQTPHLRVAGGGARSDVWCQILADVCQLPVYRPQHAAFITAVGAARLAGLYLSGSEDPRTLQAAAPVSTLFAPCDALRPFYEAGFANFRRFHQHTRRLGRTPLPYKPLHTGVALPAPAAASIYGSDVHQTL